MYLDDQSKVLRLECEDYEHLNLLLGLVYLVSYLGLHVDPN